MNKTHQIIILLSIHNGWEVKDMGLSPEQITDATVALEEKGYITSESGEYKLREIGKDSYFRLLDAL